MNQLTEKVKHEFSSCFEGSFIVVESPGRVNLIGGHTDYNDGFVLPMAIDKRIVLAMNENGTPHVRCYSVDKDENFEADLSQGLRKTGKGWPDYILGVVDRLKKHGFDVEGFDVVFGGDIPIGAGLSSSAALEGGVLFGLAQLHGWDISPVDMATIAQEAENEFVGVQCGIMDQFISLNGKANRAMKLDCRSLEYEFYPFDKDDNAIVLCDTQIRRELASSEYNVRRQQCEQAVKLLQEYNPDIQSLRDVSLDFLQQHKSDLSDIIYRRSEYIVEENERVLQACLDLDRRDWDGFGQRLFEAHEGLRDKYEVSCRELDVLVEAARQTDGVFGARMMGGGFGGCTINLVEESKLDTFCKDMKKKYKQATDKEITIYKTRVSDGTHLLKNQRKKTA